jgi:hypothetical protein
MKVGLKIVVCAALAFVSVTSLAQGTAEKKAVQPTLIDAFYNPKTGEVFVRHPTEKDVLVPPTLANKDGLEKISKASGSTTSAQKSTCTTTTQTICTHYVIIPGSGRVCGGTGTVTTTTCSP